MASKITLLFFKPITTVSLGRVVYDLNDSVLEQVFYDDVTAGVTTTDTSTGLSYVKFIDQSIAGPDISQFVHMEVGTTPLATTSSPLHLIWQFGNDILKIEDGEKISFLEHLDV